MYRLDVYAETYVLHQDDNTKKKKKSHEKVKDSRGTWLYKTCSAELFGFPVSSLLQSPQRAKWWLPGSSLSFRTLTEQIHQTPTLLWEPGTTQWLRQSLWDTNQACPEGERRQKEPVPGVVLVERRSIQFILLLGFAMALMSGLLELLLH